MGDFKVNALNCESHAQSGEFIMTFSQQLQPTVLHPTRSTSSTSTLIDNIFISNTYGSKVQSCNIVSQMSVHLPQFCIINDCSPDYKHFSHYVYDYSPFDSDTFYAEHAEFNTSFLIDGHTNLNEKFDAFLLIHHNLINKHCPQKNYLKGI